MSLPKSIKGFDRYEHYYFFTDCMLCDCVKKHRLAVSSTPRFNGDEEGARSYNVEVITIRCSCGRIKTICDLDEFSDFHLDAIKHFHRRGRTQEEEDQDHYNVSLLARYFYYLDDGKYEKNIKFSSAERETQEHCYFAARRRVVEGEAEDLIKELIAKNSHAYSQAQEDYKND